MGAMSRSQRALGRAAGKQAKLRARSEALDLVRMHGVAQASALTGIPVRTLQRWKAQARDGKGPDAPPPGSPAAEVRAVTERLARARGAALEGVVADLRELVKIAVGRAREDSEATPALIREVGRVVQALGELDIAQQLFAPPLSEDEAPPSKAPEPTDEGPDEGPEPWAWG